MVDKLGWAEVAAILIVFAWGGAVYSVLRSIETRLEAIYERLCRDDEPDDDDI